MDLAGALLLLHVLGVIAAAGWKRNPQHMRTTLPTSRKPARRTAWTGRPHLRLTRRPADPTW